MGPLLLAALLATGAPVRLLVLRAATPQEARRLAEADPAVQAGLLEVAEIRRWGISLSRCE